MIKSRLERAGVPALIRTFLLSLVPCVLGAKEGRRWHDSYHMLHETHWILEVTVAGGIALVIGFLMQRSDDLRKRGQGVMLVTLGCIAVFGQVLADQIQRGSPGWSVAVFVVGGVMLIVGSRQQMLATPSEQLAGKPSVISLFDEPQALEKGRQVSVARARARFLGGAGSALTFVATFASHKAGGL